MIRLRLLGCVDLTGPNEESLDAALRRAKLVAVLAYLAAARPRGFHRRDKLASLFWPELGADRARAALRVTLTRLRDDLGADIVLARGAEEIAIDPSLVWCDVAALDDELRAGRALAAADLFHGDLFDGVHVEGTGEELEHWIETERARIRADLVRGLVAESDRLAEAAHRDRAIAAARRAVDILPSDETANRRLIALHRAGGDVGSALAAYEALARRLARDLQVQPSSETRSLVADLRAHAATDPRRAPSATPNDEDDDRGTLQLPAAAPPSDARSNRAPPRPTAHVAVAAGAALLAIALVGAALLRPRATAATTTPSAPTARWSLRQTGGDAPLPRAGAYAVLDSTHGALLMLGGVVLGENVQAHRIMDDLWRLRGLRDGELPKWSRVVTAGEAPLRRWLYALSTDEAHDRMIMHGGAHGFTSPCSSDTWILDDMSSRAGTPTWRRVRIDGPSPPAHAGMRTSYDAVNRRLILFGGNDCFATYFNEVWVLAFDDSSLSSGRWRRMYPDSTRGAPTGRASFASAYDARSNQLYIHGGNMAGIASGELWVLEHANGLGGDPIWRPLRCSGTSPTLTGHDGAYDSTSGTWVLLGGGDSSAYERREAWRITGLSSRLRPCEWSQIALAEPMPNARRDHSVMYDPQRRAIVMQGGQYEGTTYRDAWVLHGAFER